jgi:nitronate monooxygenase
MPVVNPAVVRTKERAVIRSSFSDLFGLRFPIMNAPMASSAGGDLAAAVCNAGALGMLGGSVEPAVLASQVQLARSLTSRPFGVGFISTRESVGELQAAALDAGVTIVMHSFTVRADLFAEARRSGARVIAQVQTVEMARQALDAGAEVLVAQGNDGGGHVGSIGTMAIVPAVVDIAGDVPVLAAGGIVDGRGLAAVLMLGAQGASIGTRFYASAESTAPQYVRERLIDAGTDDTVWTRSYDIIRNADFGPTVGGRVVRNAFTDAWHTREQDARVNAPSLVAQVDAARDAGDTSLVSVWAGSGVGLVRDVEPAGTIVRDICADAEQVIRASPALLA